ncbi:Transcriptional repressor IclR [Pontivivens insulae]|uniref:Transcriptional repressor IclR n=2 Tax=Pontivivens insulae TaxID=1639689 RepID=A0A2R8ADK1_9RHOB|nr:IclR family transcriptional regulator [Pontivivens insulae]SPF30232.1 Transcriptional repressor IclR [Pontivivens insulae]
MGTPDVSEKAGQVRAVVRALSLLREIAASEIGLSLTAAAEKTGLPASTTHRLLTTMEAERFVRFDAVTGLWHIGVASFTTGAAFSRTRDLGALAKPYLRRLVDQTGETANLFIEAGGYVVCLDQAESRHTMRAITAIGGRMPMHASGAGKAMLSRMPADRRDAILTRLPLTALTPKTLTSAQDLQAALEAARQSGVAHDDEEHAEGLRCVSAAVLNEDSRPVAAVSVSGPVARITPERLEELADHVRAVAADITREFGGRPV